MLRVSISKKLPDFNLHIDFAFAGRILILFGPSGAGKTTILQCLAGLQRPDEGIIELDEKLFYSSSNNLHLPARRRKIGYVFQDYALFPHMSVKDNVLYGIPREGSSLLPWLSKNKHRCKKADYRMSVLEVLDKLKITHLQKRFPHQLSGGEKQRVALARALMVEPDLLLLDEPLSALDESTRSLLQQELIEIQEQWQIPFVMVTHSKGEARKLGDEIIYLKQGQEYQVVTEGCSLHAGKYTGS